MSLWSHHDKSVWVLSEETDLPLGIVVAIVDLLNAERDEDRETQREFVDLSKIILAWHNAEMLRCAHAATSGAEFRVMRSLPGELRWEFLVGRGATSPAGSGNET